MPEDTKKAGVSKFDTPAVLAFLERNGAEVAVDEQTVHSFQVELTRFLSHKLDGEEFGITLFEQEVVTAVDEGGIECFLP